MASLERLEIVLVEDSAEDAEMTLRALRKNHLANRVHWVKDGEQALQYLFPSRRHAERAPAQAPKLVMLDLKMPKVDGIEVLHLTSSNEERDVMEAYRLGVNRYGVKPVGFEAFLETVSKIGRYWVLTNRTPQ
ncbi:MAG TPA: response regulator [Burkholderiales bacterium]|nr:response regulator [Burkholderiales bacterium]